MHRFKNIGVVIDLERLHTDVLSHAKELVDTNQATVHLLCIISDVVVNEPQKKAIEQSLKEKIFFDFSLAYFSKKAAIEIARYSIAKNLDIILIEPDKNKSKFNHFFKGSLPLSLMRKTVCPVWVVKSPASKTYQRILIAVAPEEDKEAAKITLNNKLVEIGTSFAKRQLAECYLVTVWHLEGEAMLEGPFLKALPSEIEALKNQRKSKCARAFEKLQKHHETILKGCQTYMLDGEPGHSIAQFVSKHKIDLIVIGTLARAGMKGFLIGNTAETIVNQVDCSIMAIKPDGFVSPILP